MTAKRSSLGWLLLVRRHQGSAAVTMANRDSMTADRGSPLHVAGQCWPRREAVKSLGALVGSIALARRTAQPAWAEPRPETTRIRLVKASLCTAPAYVAEELLRAEGFSEVRYVDDDPKEIGTSKLVATGEADLNMSFGLTTLVRVGCRRTGPAARGSSRGLLRTLRHRARSRGQGTARSPGCNPWPGIDAPYIPEHHRRIRGTGPASRHYLGHVVA